MSLNPYCSGRWSRTKELNKIRKDAGLVLILIVVEDGLVQLHLNTPISTLSVLILIVVEDGLVHGAADCIILVSIGLNPYCSGRWSRTQ